MSDNRVGEVLASKYRLEELLGTGGMGNVYRATNELVGRTVAIKLLKAEHASNTQVVERFMREARSTNLVRHPNVVDVLDIGQDDRGVPFIVQEMLVGEDLARYVEKKGGKLSFDEVVEILCPVIDAVAEAHAKGVVHRDLKPENVFLAKSTSGPGASRTAKLLDFGISKVRSSDVRATEVGMMMGTPAYMPPEQVQGARDADPRSDVWALGVMLFELLAGRLPFDGDDAPALFVAIVTKDAPQLVEVNPMVSPTVSRIVGRCLRRKPDERYPSAAELSRDLQHAMDGEDLEPTGKRSVPPLAMPDAPELNLELDRKPRGGVATRQDGSAAGPLDQTMPAVPSRPELPEIPTLDLPVQKVAPKPSPSGRLPAQPQAPASTGERSERGVGSRPQPAPVSGARPPAGRLAVSGALPGVVMPPGSVPSRRSESIDFKTPPKADVAAIYGIIVVGIVLIAVIGVLMAVAHRPEGWPIAQFLIKADTFVAIGIHAFIALVAVVVGGVYAKRGVSHWRGLLSGGPVGAVVSAVVSGAAFFAAIELVTAVSN